MLNFAIIFSLFLIFIIVTGNFPGWLFLSVIPVLLLQILFAGGLGMILGVMNVFFQGCGATGWRCAAILVLVHTHCLCTEFITCMGKNLMMYNPMTRIMQSYQSIFAYHLAPTGIRYGQYWLSPLFSASSVSGCSASYAADMVDEL